jgi:hypothetical protein
MKALGILTWIAVAILVSSLLGAWSAAQIWSWFAAAQYGPGPTLGAWFGVLFIARTAVTTATSNLAKVPTESDPDWGVIVKKSVNHWVSILLYVGIAWCIGSVFGWIH